MEDKGAACTCGWLNRHVVSGQRPEPRIRNATPAGLSSPFLRGSHRDRGCSAARLWFDDRGRSMHVRTADGANVSWRRFCVASRRQAIARGDPAREYGWGGCYSTRIRINEIHDGAARGRRDVPRLVGTSWGSLQLQPQGGGTESMALGVSASDRHRPGKGRPASPRGRTGYLSHWFPFPSLYSLQHESWLSCIACGAKPVA